MISFSQLGNMGRLGNQFFQVAAVIGAAKDNGLEYRIPEWEVNKYLNRAIEKSNYYFPQMVYNEKYCTHDPINFGLEEGETLDIDMVGYFQSEKYFSKHSDLIRDYFQPSEELNDHIEEKYGFLFDEEDIASLHVRMGDYLSLRHVYAATELDYYNACLEECNPKKVLIFSDDIDFCKNIFDRRDNFCYVSERGHPQHLTSNTHAAEVDSRSYIGEDLAELFLMSRCKYNVTTNSSYSWWAAWLNSRKDKQVFAPSQWFQRGHLENICDPAKLDNYMDDLIPESWKIM